MEFVAPKQWDIWWVVWPNHDGTTKDRPAVVVSSAADVANEQVVRCWQISTQDHPESIPRLKLDRRDSSFNSTGLPSTSYVYCTQEEHFPATVPPLLNRVGNVSAISAAWLRMQFKVVGRRPAVQIPKQLGI